MAVGKKFGGRVKGTPNKLTAHKERAIAASGLTPLDYMLSILRDELLPSDARMDAAKAAAPYSHAKLQAMDANLTGDVGLTININKP